MNTRASEKNASLDLEKLEPRTKDAATTTDELLEENSQEQPLKLIQSPIFNIHIHVPANNSDTTSKMYLPRIQPVIHLHFDELVSKLKKNDLLQGKELNSRHLKNVLTQACPKFGNVSIHSKSVSPNRDSSKKSLISSTPQRVLRKNKASVTDVEKNTEHLTSEDGTSVVQNHCKNNTKSVNLNNNTEKSKTGEKLISPVNNTRSPIKLKKAVVVLEDISKSKYFREIFSNHAMQEENKMPNSLQSSSPITDTVSHTEVKIETLSNCSNCDSPDLNAELNSLGADNATNACISTNSGQPCSSTDIHTSHIENCADWKTLLSLTEGCNFSELIKKFKRSRIHLGDHKKKSNLSAKIQVKTEKELIDNHINASVIESVMETNEGESFTDNLHGNNNEGSLVDGNCMENNAEMNLAGKNPVDDESNRNEPQLPSDTNEEHQPYTLHQLLESSIKSKLHSVFIRQQEKIKIMCTGDNASQCLSKQCDATKINSGGSKITPNNKQISEDLSPGFISTSKSSNLENNRDPFVFETDSVFCSFDIEDRNNDLDFSDEEMGKTVRDKTKKQTKRKHTSQSKPKKAPSLKKMKKSRETSKKPAEKEASSKPLDYIPLDVSGGPTRFAVAPLPNIEAYKTHNAKNFKNEMLFGNRIRRFSSSNEYRIFKLKNRSRCLK